MQWLNKLRQLSPQQQQALRFVVKRTPVTRSKASITPSNPRPVVVQQPRTIKYYLSDPTTPHLVKEVLPPSVPTNPAFTVVGYQGGGFEIGTAGAQAGGVFVTVANGINTVNAMSERMMTRWAAVSRLSVVPRAGVMMNAYYDRKSLQFFFNADPVTRKTFFCADSADIVSHELGHAILDSFRPELWNVVSLETWAFHEAFGDFMAMMNVLNTDEAINYLLTQTGGNLRTENMCSNIAEQFGLTIWHINNGNGRMSQNYLRCAYNTFKYSPPATLGTNGPDNVLTGEPHSFSRVMSGALYDCFVRIYEANRGSGNVAAIKTARTTMLRYVIKAIQFMPNTSRLYRGFANTVLWADFNLGKPYHDLMWQVFQDRQIIDPFTAQSVVPALTETVSVPKLVHACEMCDSGSNPLHDLHCHVHEDEDEDDLSAALHYLNERGKVSDSPFTPFQVCEQKIVRSNFACGCGCRQPAKASPEFLRRYKPQNNAGCGGCSQTPVVVETKKPVVKRGCFARYRVVK